MQIWFTPPRVVGTVLTMMRAEAEEISERRKLLAAEARQLAAIEMLIEAMRATLRTERAFAAFAPLRPLFEAADAAARAGGLPVPQRAARHPYPVTPAALSLFTVNSFAEGLVVIVGAPGSSLHRAVQLNTILDLRDMLTELMAIGAWSGDEAATARVEAAFAAAADILAGDELAAIISEAMTIAAMAATGRPN